MQCDADTWQVTVKDLLLNFRNTLIAILPYMDFAKIKWRDGEAYDDWDDIASSLFRNIVENSLKNISERIRTKSLAPYDLLTSSYEECLYFAVVHPKKENLAFVGFSSSAVEPFEIVKCVPIESGIPTNEEILYLPLHECDFALITDAKYPATNSLIDIKVEI